MSINRQDSFWSSLSPLGGLTGAGLLIMGSARLSWAITISGSIIWVYGLSAFSFSFFIKMTGSKFFPKKGRTSLFTCFASFWGSIYLLLFWILCPFAALENFFLLMLVPLFCSASWMVEQNNYLSGDNRLDIIENISEAVSQAIILSCLLIAFSIIREPLAYCSLSFPGTFKGMMVIQFRGNSFLPIRLFVSSSGALILLGYFISLYQYLKVNVFHGEIE